MLDEAELKAILARKLFVMFPDATKRTIVKAVLDTYGLEKYEQEPARVSLAILKISGNDSGNVERNTRHAKQDFRDVLVWAETPNLGKSHAAKDKSNEKKIRDADLAQYQRWLSEE